MTCHCHYLKTMALHLLSLIAVEALPQCKGEIARPGILLHRCLTNPHEASFNPLLLP